MICYFTYNDQPSGVYYSQVCDVINHLNTLSDTDVRLFALVSVRSWKSSAQKIKAKCPGAIVWPMIPKAKNWKLNKALLQFFHVFYRPTGYMCRGVFATSIALSLRKENRPKVCFDGRGAYAAEWREYRIIDDQALIDSVGEVEREAVCQSDFRLAVSEALVKHWRLEYGYSGHDYVVVPCTVKQDIANYEPLGVVQSDQVTLVYAGSTAGWQSFELLDALLSPVLLEQEHTKVVFLSQKDKNNQALQERFPGRVEVKWLKPEQVHGELSSCDYGLLLREDTVTNQVASPTKFAEYLQAGLKVLISDKIGDMSNQVKTFDLGFVWSGESGIPRLERPNEDSRRNARGFCAKHYTKRVYRDSYLQILDALGA